METPKAVETSLHRCPVVGCHSQFSCKNNLSSHLANGCCSPHHPLRHFLDMKMPAAVGFACPACNPTYYNQVFGNAHQHVRTCCNKLTHAVAIGGYGCPQCLAIYPTQLQATQHIQDNNHHQIYPQFIGNTTSSSKALIVPLAVIKHLKKTYQAVPWHLKCLTCKINLGPYNDELDGLSKTSARLKIKSHSKNGHSLRLDARTSMTDALRVLLSKAYACTRCLCLLEVCPPSQMHHCSRSVTGQVVSVTGISLQDFLLRCALTSITSLKAENNLKFEMLHQHAANASELRCTGLAQPFPVENNCNNSNSSGFPVEKNSDEMKISNDSTDDENLSYMAVSEGESDHSESQTVLNSSSAVPVISLISESEGSSDLDCMEIPATSNSSTVLVDMLHSDVVIEVSSDSVDSIGDNVNLAKSGIMKKMKTKKTTANGGSSGISQKVSGLSRKRMASEGCEETPQIKKPRQSNESQSQGNSKIKSHPDFIPFSSAAASEKPSWSRAQSNGTRSSPPSFFNRVFKSVRKCIDHMRLRNGSFPQDVSSTNTPSAVNAQFHHCSVGAPQLRISITNSDPSRNGHGIGSSSSKSGQNSTALKPRKTVSLKVQSFKPSAKVTPKTKKPSTHGRKYYFSLKKAPKSRPKPSAKQNVVLASDNNPPKQSDANKLNSSDANVVEMDPQSLNSMNHIIFLDLDNWSKFFQVLPHNLPEKTFVWGFLGGKNVWNEPVNDPVYQDAKNRGLVYINKRCGTSKDAADFAICLMVGRTDTCIPKHIPFTILSGDRGFEELERQYQGNQRRLVVITPHFRDKYELYVLLKSVADS